MKTISKLADIR